MATRAAVLAVGTKALGVSGTEVSSGIYTEEYLSTLQGNEASLIYNRMRRGDSQVRKILSATIAPSKSAKWSIAPISEETKDVEVAALLEQILFKDIQWVKFLNESFTFVSHGHSVFKLDNTT